MYVNQLKQQSYYSNIKGPLWICFRSIFVVTMCQVQFDNNHNTLLLYLHKSSALCQALLCLILVLQTRLSPGHPPAEGPPSPEEAMDFGCILSAH